MDTIVCSYVQFMTLRSLSKTAIDRSIIAAVVDRGEAVQTHQSHMTLVVSLLLHIMCWNVFVQFNVNDSYYQSLRSFLFLLSSPFCLFKSIQPGYSFFASARSRLAYCLLYCTVHELGVSPYLSARTTIWNPLFVNAAFWTIYLSLVTNDRHR
jgi:hypothetical protein